MNSGNSTNNFRLVNAIRVKRAHIWSIASVTSGTQSPSITVTLQWCSEYGPSDIISDTTMGTANPAHVHSSPPRSSIAGDWCLAGQAESTTMFILQVNAGDIVDLECELILQNGEAIVSVGTSNSGSSGRIYEGYLDGSGLMTPVGYTGLR